MFNRLSDGLSGLKTYVNAPTLGRNQAALHIAVKSNTAFAVNQLLNAGGDPLAQDDAGNTPVHTAAFSGAYVSLQAILEHPSVVRIKGDILKSENIDGDTPLHVACKAQPPQVTAVQTLLDHGADVYAKNKETHTAIQCIMMSPLCDVQCLDTLLEFDHNQIGIVDSQGNGLLHYASTPKVVQCLMHHKIDAQHFNNDGQSALHKAVLEDDSKTLDKVMAMILNGFDVETRNAKGDTALHLVAQFPARKGSTREKVIKALVVLGGDLSAKNKSGQTVYSIAKETGSRSTMALLSRVGADDEKFLNCKAYPPISDTVMKGLLDRTSCRPREKWNMNSASVLAMDGGGVRGLVLLQMLFELERRTRQPIVHLFDWIGGTSTGCIVALAMTYSNMSLRQCQQYYFGLKDEVFKGTRPYDTDRLENYLKEIFSEELIMSSVQFPRLIIPATIADCRPAKLHAFKNFGYREENGCPSPQRQKVWEVARSSSAAPTYFTPHKRFVDGGLVANNPTIAMLTELHECNMDPGRLGIGESLAPVSFTDGLIRAFVDSSFTNIDMNNSDVIESRPVTEENPLVNDIRQEPTKPFIVVSFGTGLQPEVSVKDYNISKVDGALGAGRFLLGVKEIVETLVEQCAGTDGAVVMGAKAWCESIGSYYFRLQPQLSYNMKLDETENTNLIECLWDVQCFIYKESSKFEKVADLLMSAFN